MTQILLSLGAGVIAALVLILRENSKLKSKQKLHDLEVKDEGLKTQQSEIKKQKEVLKKELGGLSKAAEAGAKQNISDSEIEKFWENRAKKGEDK